MVDERIGLVFSWDPRARSWVKERGPENAALPPAAPSDAGAVQTYFLEPETARWLPTILGPRGRQIVDELGKFYRAPYETGLDVVEVPVRRATATPSGRRSGIPFALATLVLLVIAAAVASQTLLAPAADADGSTVPSRSVTPAAPTQVVTAAPVVAPSASAAAGTSGPTATAATVVATPPPARTAAPTPPPTPPPPQPTNVILSTTLPDGMRLFYSGPNMAPQGSLIKPTVNAVYANGEPYIYQIDVRIGNGAWTTMTTTRNGSYTATLPVNAPKGPQPVSVNVHFGTATTVYTLGSMIVQ